MRSDGLGRRAERELRRWANEHRALWTHLRENGATVHVAVITRSAAARHRYSRLLGTWLNAPSAQPLSLEERVTLDAANADLRHRPGHRQPRDRWSAGAG